MIAGLLVIGLILMSVALKGTEHEFGERLQTDVLGDGGFLVWALAILAIGAIGYLPGMRRTSHYLLALIGVVVVVRNGGVFDQARQSIMTASKAGPAPATYMLPLASGSSSGSSSGGSSSGGSSGSSLSTVATVAELAALA